MELSAHELARLRAAADRTEIAEVCTRYCRGIDRVQLDVVRDCYHPDATDDHGDYRGDVDGFIAYLPGALAQWAHTTHFVGNITIDLDGDRARVETYALAFHRIGPRGSRPERDFVAAIRYVDDFARRDGWWKIAARVVVVDWTRTDPVAEGGWVNDGTFVAGRRDRDDRVFSPWGTLT